MVLFVTLSLSKTVEEFGMMCLRKYGSGSSIENRILFISKFANFYQEILAQVSKVQLFKLQFCTRNVIIIFLKVLGVGIE